MLRARPSVKALSVGDSTLSVEEHVDDTYLERGYGCLERGYLLSLSRTLTHFNDLGCP